MHDLAQPCDLGLDEAPELLGRGRESTGIRPCRSINSSRMSGSFKSVRRSAWSLSTIVRGTLAGATSIHQDAASYPGTPISASGGTSGMAPTRSFVVTPIMRTLPLCASGNASGIGEVINAICPPARSLSAGCMPR